MQGSYALVVAGDHVRATYTELLARLELPTLAFAEAMAAGEAVRAHEPEIAILEVEAGGCIILRELRDRFGPELPAILVSADRTTSADVVAGLLVGADDYAAESMDAFEFLARARRLIERTRPTRGATADLSRLSTLTAREREILTLTARGLVQKEIARDLGISIKTVGTHMQSLLAKLGVHSRVEAVAVAVRAGAADGEDAAGRAIAL